MWAAYVIKLAANTRRMQESVRQLGAQAIAWRRLEGGGGRGLTAGEVGRVYDRERNARRAKHALVAPEIGCYLSHIAAWRAVADGDAGGGFIFEDDFAADGALARVLELLSADAGSGRWDMVKLFS